MSVLLDLTQVGLKLIGIGTLQFGLSTTANLKGNNNG
jgi:hypothetical protein